ncbi:MAG: hypothetical protein M0C28_42085 [Candidatus Moduliflexus flocculans]|nr:hypothetical protein [Candidatus Moduliflexus flocculans]
MNHVSGFAIDPVDGGADRRSPVRLLPTESGPISVLTDPAGKYVFRDERSEPGCQRLCHRRGHRGIVGARGLASVRRAGRRRLLRSHGQVRLCARTVKRTPSRPMPSTATTGVLTPIAGSPFPAGERPTAIATIHIRH